VLFDIDEKRVSRCCEGIMPIYEPNLEEVFSQVYKKNLSLTTNINDALDNTSLIFLALPTPTKTFG
jgi:UDPglucose 6-dehydrogenase